MSYVRAPPAKTRPKPQHKLQAWTNEGFKDVKPPKYHRRRGAGTPVQSSLNVVLNRYMDPREEQAAQRSERVRQQKRQQRAAAAGVPTTVEGTLNPLTMRGRASPRNPASLGLHSYESALPPLPPLPPPPGSNRKLARERGRYNPIRHTYAEPDVDSQVRAAEASRRAAQVRHKTERERPAVNPLTMQRQDGAPLPPMPTPTRGRRTPTLKDVDTSRVLIPGEHPDGVVPSASGQARRRVAGWSTTNSRAGYNILHYRERGPRDRQSFYNNPNGLTPVSRAAGGKSNVSGIGYDILSYDETGRSGGGGDARGNGSVPRTRAAFGKSNLSGTRYDIINGTPLPESRTAARAPRSQSRAAQSPAIPRRLQYTPRSESAPPGPDPRGPLSWNQGW